MRTILPVLSLLAAPLVAEGQAAKKVPVVGYLVERSGPTAFDEAFRLGLRELGYSEGRSIIVEYRWADGKAERLPALAAELVRLKVDVIVTSGTPGGLAAKNATSTIPIVMASGGDFVSDGLVASFARPGGNITGLSVFARELRGKRLEILRETIPGMTRAWGCRVQHAQSGDPTALRGDGSHGDHAGAEGPAA